MKILFVDDHPEFLKEMVAQLEDCGHDVKPCLRADDAVREIDSIGSFDVVALDIMMRLGTIIKPNEVPEVANTGLALYNRIRQKSRDIPILVITALAKDRFWRQYNFATDSHSSYLAKPLVGEGSIASIIERLVE
jgi:CheY-like chemotaxis protein